MRYLQESCKENGIRVAQVRMRLKSLLKRFIALIALNNLAKIRLLSIRKFVIKNFIDAKFVIWNIRKNLLMNILKLARTELENAFIVGKT